MELNRNNQELPCLNLNTAWFPDFSDYLEHNVIIETIQKINAVITNNGAFNYI